MQGQLFETEPKVPRPNGFWDNKSGPVNEAPQSNAAEHAQEVRYDMIVANVGFVATQPDATAGGQYQPVALF